MKLRIGRAKSKAELVRWLDAAGVILLLLGLAVTACGLSLIAPWLGIVFVGVVASAGGVFALAVAQGVDE